MSRPEHILGFRPASDTITVQERFHRYWTALRRPGEDVPTWARFDPVDVPFALGSLSVIDVVDGPDFVIRLLATNIQGRLERFRPGTSVRDFPENEQKRAMIPAFEACYRHRLPSEFESDVWEFNTVRTYRGKLWPFADEHGEVIRIVACRANVSKFTDCQPTTRGPRSGTGIYRSNSPGSNPHTSSRFTQPS